MNKTVFITGGSRGIGAFAVQEFSRQGYNVAFTYFKSKEKAKELESATGAFGIFCDVSKSDSVNDATRLATERFGGIDVLISNAGIDEFALFTDISDEMWHKMLDTNLSSAFYASRAVLPQMISRKSGVIINVSSMWGQVGASCETHYSVSKAGMIGLTKALAKEVGPSGIRVNCVCPGVIDTEMNAHLSSEDKEQLINDTPLGKIGKCEDVVNALIFLSEDKSSFITGQIFGVNGGYII
ncbi:MAG: 3-oxoacyl-ACP reductase FabG [Clostridia bacterium]|nr:3-oxoacyl-ACP reductase FabG [Clostridia bacterium]